MFTLGSYQYKRMSKNGLYLQITFESGRYGNVMNDKHWNWGYTMSRPTLICVKLPILKHSCSDGNQESSTSYYNVGPPSYKLVYNPSN